MKVYDAQSIRNVALVGHSGAGKTQLLRRCSSMPARSTGFGRVDDGTTVTDYDDEEIARKHTLSSSLAYVEWNKTQDQFHRHAGDGELPERRACRAARGRCGARGRGCGRRGRGHRPRRCGRRPRSWTCRASSC